MPVSPSELCDNLDRLLDEVLATGVPLEIDHAGRRLWIVTHQQPSVLDRLDPHPGTIIGDPEDLVEMDWSVHRNPSRAAGLDGMVRAAEEAGLYDLPDDAVVERGQHD